MKPPSPPPPSHIPTFPLILSAQAMGRQTGDGYTSDSDSSDVDVDFSIMDKIKKEVKKEGEEQRKESMYWGDNSDEEKELDSYDSELESADLWTCVTCKKPNKPYFRYCVSCWNIRRSWMAQHDRKKKKKKNRGTKPESTKINIITTPQRDSSGDRLQVDSSVDSGIGSDDKSQELEITSPVTLYDDSNYQQQQSTSSALVTSNLCLLCCHRTKNASFVHGRIGHQVSGANIFFLQKNIFFKLSSMSGMLLSLR